MGLHIAIVGGGLGGLAAAIALRLSSHRVIVLERMKAKTQV
jgi:2-polyprenyl-6-methoxyphenol hydroxylase-like FAD-dependent oxidoreductase